MKHIKNFRPLALAAILVVTSAAAAVCGLVMKGQLQKYVGGYDDKWAIAVPFLMLRDDTDWQRMLAAKDAPPAPDPEPEPEPEPDPEPEPEPEPPVVVTNAVYGQDESFFDDALFIGDSRMVNVANYARLGSADYFADVGMTVFKMFSTTASDKNFGATDLGSLLRSKQYSHIFVMLGLNEAGYPLGNLFDAYQSDLEQLRQLQPDATIYILKVYGVTADVAAGPTILWLRLTFMRRLSATRCSRNIKRAGMQLLRICLRSLLRRRNVLKLWVLTALNAQAMKPTIFWAHILVYVPRTE